MAAAYVFNGEKVQLTFSPAEGYRVVRLSDGRRGWVSEEVGNGVMTQLVTLVGPLSRKTVRARLDQYLLGFVS